VKHSDGQPTSLEETAGAPLHVLSDNAAVSRRIVATLGAPGLPGVNAISSPDRIDEDFVEESTIFILACDVDEVIGMASLRRLRRDHREPPIIVISPAATAASVRRALDAGADAFVLEAEIETALAAAARAVATVQSVVPRKVRESVERPAFSHRERQVLSCVARGLTNAQIAEELYLAESTIKSHLSSAFSKFGVRSRKEAAALFLETEHPGAIN